MLLTNIWKTVQCLPFVILVMIITNKKKRRQDRVGLQGWFTDRDHLGNKSLQCLTRHGNSNPSYSPDGGTQG